MEPERAKKTGSRRNKTGAGPKRTGCATLTIGEIVKVHCKKMYRFFYNNTPTYRCEPKVRLLIFSKNFFRTLSNHFPQWTYSIQTGTD